MRACRKSKPASRNCRAISNDRLLQRYHFQSSTLRPPLALDRLIVDADTGDTGVDAFPHQPSHSYTMQMIVPDGQGWFDRAVAAGCTVQTSYQKMFWGDMWGAVTAPFGVHWGIDQPADAS